MTAPALPVIAAVAPRRRRTARLAGLGVSGAVALWTLVLIGLVAVIGPLVVQRDPNAVDLGYAYSPPSGWFPLGADASGRDILTRLVFGAQSALVGPLFVVAIAAVLGIILGLVAVWFGGWVDALVVRLIDAIFAFPGILLAILATALFGAGLTAAVLALSIAYLPYIARVVRSAALRERNLPYIAALRVQGLTGFVISLRHILPNITGLVVANATLCFGWALIDLAALSFIGFGAQPPAADWGAMVGGGMAGVLQGAPNEALAASAVIVITVAAVNTLGDRLVTRSENRA
ncbi:ABC transporter permease [Microbacterium sp.]|uniref:ABC transporter permease n=1 Tax=Microbacterium sp. TaxID=51671 RepID=UPI0028117C5E|nr:ABC transporter permease [Microbacterium sp.]